MNKKITTMTFLMTSMLIIPFANTAYAEDPAKLEFAASLEETLGHFWALEQNLDDSNAELAAVHASHPAAELYEGMKPILQETDPGLDTIVQIILTNLNQKTAEDVTREQAQEAINDAKEVVEIARQTVVGTELSNDVEFKTKLIEGLLDTSVIEYEAAVSDGIIEEMAEFQDGSAFVWRSQQIFDEISSDLDPQKAQKVSDTFASIWDAYDVREDPETVENLVMQVLQEITSESQHTHELSLPYAQMQKGVDASEVECKEGLELLERISDGRSICVKPSSVEKLIARGIAQQF